MWTFIIILITWGFLGCIWIIITEDDDEYLKEYTKTTIIIAGPIAWGIEFISYISNVFTSDRFKPKRKWLVYSKIGIYIEHYNRYFIGNESILLSIKLDS